MKRLVTILCTLLCILGLAACQKTDAEVAKQEQQVKIDQQKVDMIEQYLFDEIIGLIDYLTTDEVYPIVSCYDNEEVEHIFNDETNTFYVDGHGLHTAVESFRNSKEACGALQTNDEGAILRGDVTAKVSGDQIIATAIVKGDKKNADVELIFTNDIFMKLEGGSLNPKSTFGELMQKAGMNTLIGMGTVFAVLILISLIIACFGLIPKIQDALAKKKAPEEPSAPVSAPVVPAQSEEDDTELVAVIAAAIAAYEGSTNTDGFVVRSIRRR